MNGSLKRTAVAAVAALALAAGVAVSTTAPAEAQQVWRNHGNYGGGHYYGGGHWHGGGWGRRWPRNPWRRDRRGGDRQFRPGYGPGPYYGPGAYGDSCWQPRPIYDAWGRYVGTRTVNVCY